MASLVTYLKEQNSGATERTRLQEGLHCVAFAMTQVTKRDITVNDMYNDVLFRASFDKYCNVDASYDELWEFCNEKKDWTESVVKSANAFKNSKFSKKNNYQFYRGVKFMNLVYTVFHALSKKEGIRLNSDKWNPGDIWATTFTTLRHFDTLAELNDFIDKSIDKGYILPISLKKVSKVATVTLQSKDNVPVVGFNGIHKPANPFLTGASVLITGIKGGNINFRSFRISANADITGEIIVKGTAARHGKTPTALLKKIMRDHQIPQMPPKKIQYMLKNDDIEGLKKIVLDLWAQCGYRWSQSFIDTSWSKRLGDFNNPFGYFQSVIHALELCAFLNNNKSLSDEIINHLFVAASSLDSNSSSFIKIY